MMMMMMMMMMAERIEILFVVETLGGLRNIVLDGISDFFYGLDAAFAKLLSHLSLLTKHVRINMLIASIEVNVKARIP